MYCSHLNSDDSDDQTYSCNLVSGIGERVGVPSFCFEALEADIRLEAIASGVEAIATRVEAIAIGTSIETSFSF